jgi:hypothetical protein
MDKDKKTGISDPGYKTYSYLLPFMVEHEAAVFKK